ncbi:hypothetical protein [Litorilituus lipolyticus]|uniref:Uncharacterized protein n=1 Tax=Litorilituus lipolyticus TaxID=2491017 RepID=A0A502L6S0_9GAMM|nr:hypothetical protein [Litorilituus lipolyticus]TPH17693.1 hypothetical protein EPA86_03840 [Litorilituus lipolyticus]
MTSTEQSHFLIFTGKVSDDYNEQNLIALLSSLNLNENLIEKVLIRGEVIHENLSSTKALKLWEQFNNQGVYCKVVKVKPITKKDESTPEQINNSEEIEDSPQSNETLWDEATAQHKTLDLPSLPKLPDFTLLYKKVKGLSTLAKSLIALALTASSVSAYIYSLPEKKPRIVHECNINGRGDVQCFFTNHGTAVGGICVDIFLQRYGSYSGIVYKDGDKVRGSSQVCSGIVQLQDVREMTKPVTFRGQVPYKFCESDDGASWTDVCLYETSVVN